jgi:PAS domain S-box-containing protein
MSPEQKNLGETFGPAQRLRAPAAWPPPNLAPKTFEEALRLLHARLFEMEEQNEELLQARAIAEAAAIADITKRKQAEENTRKISTAVEHSPVSVVITDTKGIIEYVNPFFLETTGYSRSEVLGQNIRILKSSSISSDDYDCLWQTILSGDVWRGEFCNQKKSGEIFWERASISPIKDAKGAITSFVAVKEDITERKKADGMNAILEARLLQAQKMESLGILVAGVAHNINNVLAIVMGTASLREQNVVEPKDLKAYKTIGTVCKRGRDVVKSLMQFARPTMSSQAPFELHSLIMEVCVLLENTTNNRIAIVKDFIGEPIWINGDSSAINHALMNICINSLNAMPNGGTITLRTSVPEKNWVSLSVTDDGAGMNSEVLAHVMEPFYTTKEAGKGTGLGLSMTYGPESVSVSPGGPFGAARGSRWRRTEFIFG